MNGVLPIYIGMNARNLRRAKKFAVFDRFNSLEKDLQVRSELNQKQNQDDDSPSDSDLSSLTPGTHDQNLNISIALIG